MSGRWRSRYWRQDDQSPGDASACPNVSGDRDSNGDRGTRAAGGERGERGGDGVSDREWQRGRNQNGPNDDVVSHRINYQPPMSSTSGIIARDDSSRPARRQWVEHSSSNRKEDLNNEWRRAQPLPSAPSTQQQVVSSSASSNSIVVPAKGGADKKSIPSTVKSNATSGNVRASFPPAPAKGAWGQPAGAANKSTSHVVVKVEEIKSSDSAHPVTGTKNNTNNYAWRNSNNNKPVKVEERATQSPSQSQSQQRPQPQQKPHQKQVNAWGKPDNSSTPQQKMNIGGATVKTQSEMTTSTFSNRKNTSGGDSQQQNNNPWGAGNKSTGAASTAAPTSDKSMFPSLSVDNKKSTSLAAAAAEAASIKSATATTPTEKKIPSTTTGTMPSTSSWGGKSQHVLPSSAGWGGAKASALASASSNLQPTKEPSRPEKEEFPSLSSALSAPRNQRHQHYQAVASAPSSSSSAMEQSNNDNNNNNNGKNGSKKMASTANLASFLSPQLQGNTSSNNDKNNKKQQQQQQKQSVSNTKSQNAKSSSKPNNNNHTTSNNNNNNKAGMKRSAPSSITTTTKSINTTPSKQKPSLVFQHNKPNGTPALKKGRQRLTPRKKKLTTLKKRVLEERLRMWKELHPEDNDIVHTDTNDLGDDGQSAKKRVKTEEETSIITKTTTAAAAMDSKPSMSTDPNQLSSSSTTLLLENFIRPEEDDLEDEDEYDEIISNLISLAGRVGKVLNVFVPRPTTPTEKEEPSKTVESESNKWVGWAFVRYATNTDVRAAKDILNGMVVGGQQIGTFILEGKEIENWYNATGGGVSGETNANGNINANVVTAPSEANERQWQMAVMQAMQERKQQQQMAVVEEQPVSEATSVSGGEVVSSSSSNTVVFHNILCDDDFEDDEALEESIEDIKGLAMEYGQVFDARAVITGAEKGNVYVSYNDREMAERAVQQLNGMVVSGTRVLVSLMQTNQQSGPVEVVLDNVLNENDFDDEDCLEESIEDISSMARKYGALGKVYAENTGEHLGRVHVEYTDGLEVAHQAAKEMDGMVFGGMIISAAVLSEYLKDNSNKEASATVPPPEKQDEPEKKTPLPMLSGDKVIPERFAACKRVPKIPNAGVPREYASKIHDERAIPLIIEMLGELMRLQERNKGDKNARARRRLVMGLREVARGIRAHKVKMVVMANNLDEYGAIDSKLQEILDMARAEDVPVVFELNKRKLGKALGKSIKVAVVGIQNPDGAHEQFKKLKKIMGVL